ncbi:MAG: hypothetical protein ABL949_09560 [Fimbriimonadaceae bacterium]
MAVVPSKKLACSVWANTHAPIFKTNATALGLVAAQTTGLETKALALTNAILAQNNARDAAIAATEAADAALADLKAQAASCIASIRAKADASADPTAVYNLALIPVPAQPSPSGPPSDATDVSAHLRNDGTIQLTWKGTSRNGQFFTVWRKLSTQQWAQIGSTAKKQFIDSTLTAGTTSATYMVRSQRGDQVSQGSEPVVIVFGTQNISQAA